MASHVEAMKVRIRRWVTAFDEAPMESGFVLGAVTAVVLIIGVFATGSTFGQRCAKVFPKDSPEWHQCIKDLAAGKKEKD